MKKTYWFLVRNDFYTKFGGDTHQIQQYVENQNNIDMHIKTLSEAKMFDRGDFLNVDAFILVNIDRVYEAVAFFRILKRHDLMNVTFLLPIHHSLVDMNRFNKQRYSYWNLLSFIGGVFFIERSKSIVFCLRDRDYKNLFFMLFLRLQRELRNLICEAKGIIFIAEGERLNLFVDYKVESSLIDSIVIRNGVSSQAYEQSQSLDNKFRDIDVLVCGRIEERKNQVNLAKIFAGEPVNISFLGALNENNVAYCEEFINLIENNDNLTYLGAVDSLSTSLYFRKAKIHLSASFFEVSSLVDIEAYYAGCAVISSKNGFSGEILKGDGVVFIDPYSRDDILARTFEMLESYNTNGYPNRATESHLTWQKAAAELVAYVA